MNRRPIRSTASIFHEQDNETTTYTDIFCGSSMRPLHQTSSTVTFRLHGEVDVIQTWPTSCSQMCWHCRHVFGGPPASIPMQYDYTNDTWHMKGIFCSFACAKRHVLDMKLFNVASVLFNMKKVAALFGVTDRILAAPPMYALKVFGGHMDIAEFRESTHPIFGCSYPFFNYGMGTQETRAADSVVGLTRQPRAPKRKGTKKTGMYEKFLKDKPKKKRKAPPKASGGMTIFMKPGKKSKQNVK